MITNLASRYCGMPENMRSDPMESVKKALLPPRLGFR
jgi:hypothetical protein